MFHCNGWCFPWSIAACAGTNVCLRRTTAANIYAAISTHRVTHFCGAPIIMQVIRWSRANPGPGPALVLALSTGPGSEPIVGP